MLPVVYLSLSFCLSREAETAAVDAKTRAVKVIFSAYFFLFAQHFFPQSIVVVGWLAMALCSYTYTFKPNELQAICQI